ncbi:MAG: UDP-4-amino-4,6-dideoxy-N-acetyl-beta-L-altrosamine transaminase [bacterium]
MNKIPYGKQHIDKEDIKAVMAVLSSDWLTQGPKIEGFETKLAKFCGAKYAVAVSSGTAALHLAYLAAGFGKGDEIITTPITFLSTANAALYVGAKPIFADIDYDSANISPEKIKSKIVNKTKAIVPVHFAGCPCDMKEIFFIAEKNKIMIIEDACHALGAEYKINGQWEKVGNCRYSDMTVFSFHPVKHITTGEGGAITTNSQKLYRKLKALKTHGIYKDSSTAKKGQWYYEMRDLGFNYRITDFQCALGISQLEKIDKFVARRRQIAGRYNEAFREISKFVGLPEYTKKDKKHSWHLYVLRVKFEKLKINRKELFANLNKAGIFPQVHYIPIHQQPYYKKYICKNVFLKNAEKYYGECISLPIFPSLDKKSQNYVIKVFRRIVLKNAK